MPDFHLLSVGQPYIPGRTAYPEAVQYNYYQSGTHELLLWLPGLSEREVAAIRSGSCEFALYAGADLLILLYRFGTAIPWSDAPYSWHLVPHDQQALPPPLPESEEGRALLHIILVDADTGLIRVLRAVTFSPRFTAVLHAAIREQAARPFNPAAYDWQLQTLYQHYPTTNALLNATTARTQGGT